VNLDKEGKICKLEPQSGNELLASSAVEAVKEWKFRPYRLNGEPIAAESQVKNQLHARAIRIIRKWRHESRALISQFRLPGRRQPFRPSKHITCLHELVSIPTSAPLNSVSHNLHPNPGSRMAAACLCCVFPSQQLLRPRTDVANL
jgi:hypothetical protein